MTEEFENAVANAFGLRCFSYNDQITEDFWRVLQEIASWDALQKPAPCTLRIAEKLGLDRNYVELIQYIICNNGMAEYGTSPRCCWLTEKGKATFEHLKEIADKDD